MTGGSSNKWPQQQQQQLRELARSNAYLDVNVGAHDEGVELRREREVQGCHVNDRHLACQGKQAKRRAGTLNMMEPSVSESTSRAILYTLTPEQHAGSQILARRGGGSPFHTTSAHLLP